MNRRSPIAAVALSLAVCVGSQSALAASLQLESTERFLMGGVGVVASDGSHPIPPAIWPGLPTVGAVTSGTISLGAFDPQTHEAALSFSFSMFSDTSPLVLSGSYGDSDIPVTLRIDELRYESPAPGQPPAILYTGPQWERFGLSGSVTGTLRGSLTVGTTTAPFSVLSDSGWYSDGTPGGLLPTYVDQDGVTLGYLDGLGFPGGIVSGLGTFPATDLLTLDGVTFGLPAIYPEFFVINYVPEPSAAALLAVAALLFLLVSSAVGAGSR